MICAANFALILMVITRRLEKISCPKPSKTFKTFQNFPRPKPNRTEPKTYGRAFRPKVRQLVLSWKHGSNMSTPYQATQFAPSSPEQKRKPCQTLYKRINNTGGGREAPAPCIIERGRRPRSFIQCLTRFSFLFGRTWCELRGLVRCAHVGAMFST